MAAEAQAAAAARRFLPVALGALERPLLHVVVDTEEEFDWTGPFSRANTAVTAIGGLPRAHRIFRRHGVVPSYLLDYPVAIDQRAADMLGPWLEEGSCIVGAQLHAWVTPPFDEVICPVNTYSCNLPLALERRKLGALTEAIVARFGIAPRVYKAGRYGLDIRREPMLREFGYCVDTSVMPNRSYAGIGGGPDFFGFPEQPFWMEPDRHFLYLPNTQSVVGPLRPVLGRRLTRAVYSGHGARMRLPGLLARLGLAERIGLTPESVSLEEMCRLARNLHAAGHRVFALSMHSSSFMAGGTPYTRTDEDLDRMMDRIDRFLGFFRDELGGQAISAIGLRERFQALAA
jgi:hypothetical protein